MKKNVIVEVTFILLFLNYILTAKKNHKSYFKCTQSNRIEFFSIGVHAQHTPL